MVPPGEGRDSALQTVLSGIQRTIFMNYQYGFSICFLAASTLQLLVNEFFVFPRRGSIPAQQFLGLIILLFCLLASLACEPDVYKNALTVNYCV